MVSPAHGRFHWNELLTHDVDAAKAFYSSTMGWLYDEMKMPGGLVSYVAIKGNDPVAGIMPMPEEMPAGTRPHWMGYIEVDDVDAAVAKAKTLGAEILKEPVSVPEVGRLAVIQDPSGGVIGWITPDFND